MRNITEVPEEVTNLFRWDTETESLPILYYLSRMEAMRDGWTHYKPLRDSNKKFQSAVIRLTSTGNEIVMYHDDPTTF